MLAWLDDAVKDQADQFGGQYCTAVYGVLERGATTSGASASCSAAIRARCTSRPARRPELVGRPGSVLGLLDEPVFHETELTLAPGDTLLLYTDGVTDVAGPSALDDAGLLAVVAEAMRDSPEATVTALYQALEARHARVARRDDTAILALHRPAIATAAHPAPRSSSPRSRRAPAGRGASCATRSSRSTCRPRRSTTPSSSRPSW